MKYGIISGNSSINSAIYRCFDFLKGDDQRRFVRKFRQLTQENQQLDLYRELLLGAYLASHGLIVKYDHQIENKTPDWVIMDREDNLIGIVELTNFHVDRESDNRISKSLETQGYAIGWAAPNETRLYFSLQNKALAYGDLIAHFQVPYVIGLFGSFTANVTIDEISICLFDENNGLFRLHPELSGVIFFEESSGKYNFRYFHSEKALREISLPEGVF